MNYKIKIDGITCKVQDLIIKNYPNFEIEFSFLKKELVTNKDLINFVKNHKNSYNVHTIETDEYYIKANGGIECDLKYSKSISYLSISSIRKK